MVKVAFLFVLPCAAATIVNVSANTTPGYGGSPDCAQQSAGSYIQCSANGAGAGGEAQAWYNGTDQASVWLQIGADRLGGSEQATASALATVDVFLTANITGTITGTYSYALGQFWMVMPTLTISQGGVVASVRSGQGAITVTSNVQAGIPFEEILSLSSTVWAPEGSSSASAYLFQFTDAAGNRVAVVDPIPTPEPGTFYSGLLALVLVPVARRFAVSSKR